MGRVDGRSTRFQRRVRCSARQGRQVGVDRHRAQLKRRRPGHHQSRLDWRRAVPQRCADKMVKESTSPSNVEGRDRGFEDAPSRRSGVS